MRRVHWFSTSAMAALLFGALIATTTGPLAAGSHSPAQGKEAPTMDIVDTAVNAGSFNTLVKAVQAAGLVDTLKGQGPFTVFAPTDDAFAKLPQGTLDGLLKNKAKLAAVLTYHVVPGKVMAADVAKIHSARTVEGQELTIRTQGGVKVDAANVIKTDIETTNGVIHVIDSVLLPKE
jgi:uncharacterized surface protein with fasciclin (FAS1) repeats